MAFDLINSYQPRTFDEILEAMVAKFNQQFDTSYDAESIVGTDGYKYFYAGIQEVMFVEAKIAEITSKMMDYVRTANENINLPRSTIDGFTGYLEKPEEEGGLGLISTIKPITNPAEAGYLFLCVDANDGTKATGEVQITEHSHLTNSGNDTIKIGATTFTASSGSVTLGAATFSAATSNEATAISLAAQVNAHAVASLEVFAQAIGATVKLTAIHGGVDGNNIDLIYTNVAGSIGATVSGAKLTGGVDNPTYSDTKQEILNRMHDCFTGGLYFSGLETGEVVAENGQVFDYAYALPNPVDILVRITATVSANAKTPILNENQIRAIFDANFAKYYRIGLNFEPEKYLEIERDLPFASNILLEYSENGGTTYSSSPKTMSYNQKINITAPATIIIN